MSVDSTQVQPSLTDALLPVLTPVVQQAVDAASAEYRTRIAALEAQAAALATKEAPVVMHGVLEASASILHDVETDVTTQRVLVWGVAGTVAVAALIIIIAALLGNATANHYIAAAPAAAAALVLWLSDAGVSLPTRKKTTV